MGCELCHKSTSRISKRCVEFSFREMGVAPSSLGSSRQALTQQTRTWDGEAHGHGALIQLAERPSCCKETQPWANAVPAVGEDTTRTVS